MKNFYLRIVTLLAWISVRVMGSMLYVPQDYDEPDETFDTIISCECWEHNPLSRVFTFKFEC